MDTSFFIENDLFQKIIPEQIKELEKYKKIEIQKHNIFQKKKLKTNKSSKHIKTKPLKQEKFMTFFKNSSHTLKDSIKNNLKNLNKEIMDLNRRKTINYKILKKNCENENDNLSKTVLSLNKCFNIDINCHNNKDDNKGKTIELPIILKNKENEGLKTLLRKYKLFHSSLSKLYSKNKEKDSQKYFKITKNIQNHIYIENNISNSTIQINKYPNDKNCSNSNLPFTHILNDLTCSDLNESIQMSNRCSKCGYIGLISTKKDNRKNGLFNDNKENKKFNSAKHYKKKDFIEFFKDGYNSKYTKDSEFNNKSIKYIDKRINCEISPTSKEKVEIKKVDAKSKAKHILKSLFSILKKKSSFN